MCHIVIQRDVNTSAMTIPCRCSIVPGGNKNCRMAELGVLKHCLLHADLRALRRGKRLFDHVCEPSATPQNVAEEKALLALALGGRFDEMTSSRGARASTASCAASNLRGRIRQTPCVQSTVGALLLGCGVKPFFKDAVQGQLQGARCYDGLTNVDNASSGGQSMRQKTKALEQLTCIIHHCIVERKRCTAMPTDGTRTCIYGT